MKANIISVNRILLPILFGLFMSFSSQAAIVVTNGLSHEYSSTTGSIDKGVIKIQNTSDKEVAILVYQKDFHFDTTGQTYFRTAGDLPRSNANWMVINPLNMVIPAKGEAEVAFVINVPNNDSLDGTYWSAIMIEPGVDPSDTAAKSRFTVRTSVRYAIQIINHVGDKAAPKLSFASIENEYYNERLTLVVDLVNDGDKSILTNMVLEIYDNEGNSLGTFESKRKRLYPSTSRRFLIELPDLPKKEYTAILIADANLDEVFGIELTLDLNDG